VEGTFFLTTGIAPPYFGAIKSAID